MKRNFTILVCLIAGMLFTADLFAQAQIYTRKEKRNTGLGYSL